MMDTGALNVKGLLKQSANSALQVASGGTSARPAAPAAGMIRYNSDLGRFESYGSTWANVGSGDGTVTSVNVTGSTGITVGGSPISSSGTITLTLGTELQGLAGLAANGLVTRTGAGTYSVTSTTTYLNRSGDTMTGTLTLAADPASALQAATKSYVDNAVVSRARVYRTSFTNASLANGVLTVNHNIGQQFSTVQVTDNTNAMVQPDNINLANSTQATVDLSSFGALTGTWNVVVIG